MAKQIKKQEIYEADLLEPLIKQGKELLSVLDANTKALSEFAKEQAKIAKGANTNSAKGIKELEQATKNLNETQKEKLKLDKQKEQLEAKLKVANSEAIQKNVELKVQLEQQNRTNKQLAREKLKLVGAYEKESKKLIELRKRYKDLLASGRGAEKQTKELGLEVEKLDKKLKDIDASAGQFQRNVGNYGEAFSGIKDSISSIDISGKGGGLFSGISSGISGIASKLGPVGIALAGVVTGAGALTKSIVDVENEFNRLTREAQKATGLTGDALDELVVKTKALADTFGEDSNDLLLSQNVLIKEFGLSADEAFNIVKTGLQSSANAQGDLLDNIREYSSQIKASGGSATDLVNILNQAGKEGVFSDKGIDVVKEFGLRIREQTKATSDALKGAFGDEFTNRLLEGVRNGTITSIDALRMVSKELKNVGDVAKAQTVIADVFGGPGEDAGRRFLEQLQFTKGSISDIVDETDPLIEQQNRQLELNEEIAKAQQDLAESALGTGATFEEIGLQIELVFYQILGGIVNFFSDWKNGTNDFVNFFLSQFELIGDSIGVIVKLLKGDFSGAWESAKQAATDLFNNLTFGAFKAEQSTGKLTKALERQGKVMKLTNKLTQTAINLAKEEAVRVDQLFDALIDESLTREERNKLIDELNTKYPELLQNIDLETAGVEELAAARDRLTLSIINNALAEARLQQQEQIRERATQNIFDRSEAFAKLNSVLRENGSSLEKLGISFNDLFNDTNNSLDKIREKFKFNTVIEEQLLSISRLSGTFKGLNEQAELLPEAYELAKQNADELLQVFNDPRITQYQQQINVLRQELSKLGEGDADRVQDINTEIGRLEEEIRKILFPTLDALNAKGGVSGTGGKKGKEQLTDLQKIKNEIAEIRKEQEKLVKIVDGQFEVIDEETFQKNASRIDQLKQKVEDAELFLSDNELEKADFIKVDKVEVKSSLNENIVQPVKEANEEVKDSFAELADAIAGLFEVITDIIAKQLDKQIQAQEKFIQASQGRQDFLRQQAAEGNQLAKDSLAAEEAAQAKAEAKKAQAERRKRQLESASIILENIANLVGQGKSIGEATSISIASFEAVKALLSNLPAFYDGTENTGKGGTIDNKKGFLSVLHPDERVMTAEQNRLVGGMSNWELAELAQSYNKGVLTPDIQAKSVVNAYSNKELLNELKSVREEIKNKPTTNIEMGRIMEGFIELHETTIKGRKKSTKTYRFRK